MFKRVSGTKDILPEEISTWQRIEETSRKIFSLYHFQEIRPPILEDLALFNRSLGDSTEIVQKQMFVINNKGETYALRPEGTASVVRAYIENNLQKTSPFSKFYYIGPMFRLERPQKGRLRQFNHIGCEAIGSCDPSLDIEIIALADSILRNIAINDYRIKLNSLGCHKDKSRLTEELHKALINKTESLCEDCKIRIKNNVLRVLDCKNESCKKITESIKIGDNYLCTECKYHFEKVKSGLNLLGIKFEVAPHLVRGLDYYTQTVFEITHKDLGSQDAIGAGGRYNNLVKELGGPETGAIGFAFGVERMLISSEIKNDNENDKLVYVITIGEAARNKGMEILQVLRENGIAAEMDYEGKSIKGAMRKASDLKAKYALILGDNELCNNSITIKDMITGEQKEVKIPELVKELEC